MNKPNNVIIFKRQLYIFHIVFIILQQIQNN